MFVDLDDAVDCFSGLLPLNLKQILQTGQLPELDDAVVPATDDSGAVKLSQGVYRVPGIGMPLRQDTFNLTLFFLPHLNMALARACQNVLVEGLPRRVHLNYRIYKEGAGIGNVFYHKR